MKHTTVLVSILAIVRTAPISNTEAPTTKEMKNESEKLTRPTRSYVGDLDYVVGFDWNNDFLKYYNFPVSYDLTLQVPNFDSQLQPQFNYNLDYSSHGPPPVVGHHERYEEPPPKSYVYSQQLFFENIPHVKLLLENQQLRKYNNLPPNYLGSIRKGHPFERYVQK